MLPLYIILLSASALALPNGKPFYSLEDAEHHFEQFIQNYERVYANEEEKQMRFEIFKQSLKIINEKNMMENEHATFGITKFADKTKDEMKSYHGWDPLNHSIQNREFYQSCNNITVGDEWTRSSISVPDSFDWRDKNAVSEVKNQGECGSCWAFSTIGNIESQYAIKHGEIVTFSEQQLVDCNIGNDGCGGGLFNLSFSYEIENGMMTESDYQYEAEDGQCRYDVNKVKAKLTKCYNLNLKDEEKLKEYLYETGPVSIAIAGSALFFYHNGILRNCDGRLNHAVLLVGYGIENGLPFWTIKNSWGTDFGEKGFFRVVRGKNSCSMMNEISGTSEVA